VNSGNSGAFCFGVIRTILRQSEGIAPNFLTSGYSRSFRIPPGLFANPSTPTCLKPRSAFQFSTDWKECDFLTANYVAHPGGLAAAVRRRVPTHCSSVVSEISV
jgi:hypothetical protein